MRVSFNLKGYFFFIFWDVAKAKGFFQCSEDNEKEKASLFYYTFNFQSDNLLHFYTDNEHQRRILKNETSVGIV